MAKGQTGKWVEGRRKTHLLIERAQDTEPIEYFYETQAITNAAATTAVPVLSEARVGANRKVHVLGFTGVVSGANWDTTGPPTIKIQDTNSSAVDFVTITANAATTNSAVVSYIGLDAARVVPGAGMSTPGGTLGKGLQLKGSANVANAAVMTITVWGIIK